MTGARGLSLWRIRLAAVPASFRPEFPLISRFPYSPTENPYRASRCPATSDYEKCELFFTFFTADTEHFQEDHGDDEENGDGCNDKLE